MQERLDVLQVHHVLLLTKLQLEEVKDKGISIHIGIVHVGLNSLSKVSQADLPSLFRILTDRSAKKIEALDFVEIAAAHVN